MEEGKYGEFAEIVDGQIVVQEGEIPVRVRMPRKGEIIGIIFQRLGGNRMSVLATDGKTRNCRVPGRFKRSMWLRARDVVLIEPWPDDDNKADIIFKYNSFAINQLRRRGILDKIKVEF